ncbi:hypothetical protein EDF78_101459 [Rahnella sp. BIGb0236]|nr:hypothetical protein EDF78_101459 [Rahnella sp. BIGb0236]VTQ52307.1 Uncharacterised protein [Campylobacter jejuni]
MPVLYFSTLALSLFLFFPMSPEKIIYLLLVLIVFSLITKSRGMKTHRWIFIIQFACSIAVVVKTYQQYNFFICIFSLFICVFFVLLTAPLIHEDKGGIKVTNKMLPSAPKFAEHDVELKIRVNDLNTNIAFIYDEYKYKNGYFHCVSEISAFRKDDCPFGNQLLLKSLHQETKVLSRLAGQVIHKKDVSHLSADSLYAFFDNKMKIKGLQSGEFSIVFEEHDLTAIRIIEYTCRGSEWYELTLETCEDRIFLDDLLNEHHKSDLDIHKFAILLAKVWNLPLEYSHINMN